MRRQEFTFRRTSAPTDREGIIVPWIALRWGWRAAFIATSLPDRPGWRAEAEVGSAALRVETVNHAFVGIWLPSGKHTVRLTYRPPSFPLGLTALAAGLVFAAVLAATARPRPS